MVQFLHHALRAGRHPSTASGISPCPVGAGFITPCQRGGVHPRHQEFLPYPDGAISSSRPASGAASIHGIKNFPLVPMVQFLHHALPAGRRASGA